jgi:hypothetical protein
MLFARRWLSVLLGGLRRRDGALQLQPFTLTTGFAHDVRPPAAAGQPQPVPLRVHATRAAALAIRVEHLLQLRSRSKVFLLTASGDQRV